MTIEFKNVQGSGNFNSVDISADSPILGAIFTANGIVTYGHEPIRWMRIEAPTVGRAWKAPVYMTSNGQEVIDFNAQIEIDWNEEI